MNILDDIKHAFNKATIVEKIIYINVALFLITAIFNQFTIEWFALPANLNAFLEKPWTLISYAFIHERLIHVLSNLLILYYIGNLFLDFYTKKQFVNFYFLGVIVGALVFLTYYYVTGKTGSPLGGASAAVTTIFVAIATKIPRYALRLRFIGSVELWVLAAIWVGLSILQLSNPNNGGAIAHLGGAVFGFMYSKQLEKGNDIGKWFENLINYFTNLFKPKNKQPLKTVYKSTKKTSGKEISKSKQKKIDDILDKISKSGYESLSQDEKDFLFSAGKK
ncbi:rhomboid family intramembrane serine protease [Lutibacter sp. B1]|uniref:rhomboid family intramembrane serine protease n=1 Tax=Lutibacter sp. B1 TaxID=2725996 RepID=UPI0014571C30|nr:rhomboid family intramembrane serine protease [Lutibacter sp. B1]NLP58407.1 rhomboid family intramembrane serine protease [Lutibacter sp. B1]